MWVLLLQRLALDAIIDIAYFPFWWYTAGFMRVLNGAKNWIAAANMNMAPGLWLRNLFVPMFGQTDVQGRIMSVFMRFANVIGRSIGLLIWILIVLFFLMVWLSFPLFVLYMMIRAISG